MTTIPEPVQRLLDGVRHNTGLPLWEERTPLTERMRRAHTPGMSLAVVDGGEVAWAGGVGVMDASEPTPRPVTPETLFQAASISKPVFALLVMRLCAEGVLDLDRDVNDYLANAAWQVPANDGWQPRVTLRHLLTHTAGLTVHGFPGYRRADALPSLAQILTGEPPANTGPVRCNLVPGLSVRYSGGGTTAAQLVVESVTGRPLAELMDALVLGPLGMARSTFAQPLPEARHREAATAHPWRSEPVPGKWHVYPEQAPAGLWTTPSDLARLGLAMQRALAGEAVSFITPALAEAMLTPQFGEENGLAWWLSGKGEALRFGHSGSNEGFLSNFTMYARRGQGAVVMINANQGMDLLDDITNTIAHEFGWPDYAAHPQPVPAAADELAQWAGTYESEGVRAHRFEVRARDGRLLVQVDEQQPLSFFATEGGFATQYANARLAFEADKLVWSQEGTSTTAAKRAAA